MLSVDTWIDSRLDREYYEVVKELGYSLTIGQSIEVWRRVRLLAKAIFKQPSAEVKVNRQFLVNCIPHIAWGVVCSMDVRLPDWLSEEPHGRIPELFRLLAEEDERAIAFIDEIASESDSEACTTWKELMAAIRGD